MERSQCTHSLRSVPLQKEASTRDGEEEEEGKRRLEPVTENTQEMQYEVETRPHIKYYARMKARTYTRKDACTYTRAYATAEDLIVIGI